MLTANLPTMLQEEFERTAQLLYDHNSTQQALVSAIELWLERHRDVSFETKTAEQKMAREIEAFRHLHPQLWERYPYEFVAINQGKAVDHDKEKYPLLLRIEQQYPHQVVLIRQIRPQIDAVYTMYSTRFVDE